MNKEINSINEKEHLLRKLNQVFKDGYRPVRRNEPYNFKLKNGLYVYECVNCLGHVFNLTNQQFNDYDFGPYKMYGKFPLQNQNSSLCFNERMKNTMFDFIKETGLKIEECDPNKPIEDFKSWKIALYFLNTRYHKDFHYIFEESPNIWSSKSGYKPQVDYIQTTNLPDTYINQTDIAPDVYNLYGTYKITNVNADENNPYVKDRML